MSTVYVFLYLYFTAVRPLVYSGLGVEPLIPIGVFLFVFYVPIGIKGNTYLVDRGALIDRLVVWLTDRSIGFLGRGRFRI